MLFKRDYRKLTPEEQELWKKAEEKLQNPNGSQIQTEQMRKEYRAAMPLAALHYKEMFPNNWLDARRLTDEKNAVMLNEFRTLINSKPNERQVLNFIKEKHAYFIVGSILGTHFRFGHHELFLFNEFGLSPSHIVDYVLIGKNSAGYHFVFVEFESPYGQVTTRSGEFSTVINKGWKQINDWKFWLEANFNHLSLFFEKEIGEGHLLPNEFRRIDKTRLNYVIVAGRRDDFNAKTYQLRGILEQENNIMLMHYDNLMDSAEETLKRRNF